MKNITYNKKIGNYTNLYYLKITKKLFFVYLLLLFFVFSLFGLIYNGEIDNFFDIVYDNYAVFMKNNANYAVKNIIIEGNTFTSSETIVKKLHWKKGEPILLISPHEGIKKIQEMPWIRGAFIERNLPNTLKVHVKERRPIARILDNKKNIMYLVDQDGRLISKHVLDFITLPIISGPNVTNLRVLKSILQLKKIAKNTLNITAIHYIDKRRFNIVLDNKITVLLPANKEPEQELDYLIYLNKKYHILKNDRYALIDLRLSKKIRLVKSET